MEREKKFKGNLEIPMIGVQLQRVGVLDAQRILEDALAIHVEKVELIGKRDLEIVSGINSVEDRRSLKNRMVDFCRYFQFDHCTVHTISSERCPDLRRIIETTYPTPWLFRYMLCNYQKIDPVIKATRTWQAPFFWDETHDGNGEAEKFFANAKKYGVGPSGFTYVSSSKNRPALAVSASSTDEAGQFRNRLHGKFDALCRLSEAFCRAFLRVNYIPNKLEALCEEEMQYLRDIWVRPLNHCPPDSETSAGVGKIRSSIASKLGCHTFEQALLIIGKSGFLDQPVLLVSDCGDSPSEGRGS